MAILVKLDELLHARRITLMGVASRVDITQPVTRYQSLRVREVLAGSAAHQ